MQVLKQVHPDCSMSKRGMSTMNSFIRDIFERIAEEGRKLVKYNKKGTLTSREIQVALWGYHARGSSPSDAALPRATVCVLCMPTCTLGLTRTRTHTQSHATPHSLTRVRAHTCTHMRTRAHWRARARNTDSHSSGSAGGACQACRVRGHQGCDPVQRRTVSDILTHQHAAARPRLRV